MKKIILATAALAAIALHPASQAQSVAERLERVRKLLEPQGSQARSASDPVLGQARLEARAHPTYPVDDWPSGMVEGYFARDKEGCVFFFPKKGSRQFAFGIDAVEVKVDGQWQALEMQKLNKEMPRHCTGGGG